MKKLSKKEAKKALRQGLGNRIRYGGLTFISKLAWGDFSLKVEKEGDRIFYGEYEPIEFFHIIDYWLTPEGVEWLKKRCS